MHDNLRKITNGILWILIITTLVIMVLYFLNLDVIESGMDTTWAGRMLVYGYILVGVATVAAVFAAVLNFVLKLVNEPKKALLSIIPILTLIVLIFIAYTMASDTPLNMPNYDGADNVPQTLKLVGTSLYTMYFLLAMAVIFAITSEVSKIFK